MNRRAKIASAAGAAVVMAGIGAGVSYAAIPDSGTGVISGCYSTVTGTVKVIDAQSGKTCGLLEKSLTWNQLGPIGATGPVGPAGAAGSVGATGAQGPKGDTGDAGPQGDTGAQGPKGAQGNTGSAGSNGVSGTAVSFYNIKSTEATSSYDGGFSYALCHTGDVVVGGGAASVVALTLSAPIYAFTDSAGNLEFDSYDGPNNTPPATPYNAWVATVPAPNTASIYAVCEHTTSP
jgi:hypothetical protein